MYSSCQAGIHPQPICNGTLEELIDGDDFCASSFDLVSSPFAECLSHPEMNGVNFRTRCKLDVCSVFPDGEAMKDSACAFRNALSIKCRMLGYAVDNWRLATGCCKAMHDFVS